MEDKTPVNQAQTASMNRTKAPQKVEVVVANSSSGSEVNILGELSIFVLRIGFCALMIHHGLEKLQDPQGFAEFVVGKYFHFCQGILLFGLWSSYYSINLSNRISNRDICKVSSLGLFSTMAFAVYFHLLDTGLEGFPLAVVEGHNYAFELSFIYGAISLFSMRRSRQAFFIQKD